jgi:hypothetical protein
MRSILLLTLLLASCATERIGSADRVGNAGSLRITASHYQSMAGVMLKEEDSPTTCKREMITGSHILSWYCNFGDDAIQYQLDRRIVLDSR